ncbi:MOP flippase family protein [Geomonas sp. Red32]|uniref:MOP flippase family protein n=1 Tax=Geomonas sp. Red32 TaxID=2912856 RepID=UPI00202CE9FD|nr:MOP flippase family protein [Geomonas sp. Red32]MCM0083600.1 MOP flippase family protein [Geomonas sp. Red32]
MSLVNSITRGLTWSAMSQVARQATALLTTALLARLLSPADFGVVGMATIVVGFLAIFKDLGTASAVIQRRELSKELASSIFYLNVSFGLGMTLLLLLLAPLAAVFYREPQVTSLLRGVSITFLISSCTIVHQSFLEKDLKFNVLAKIDVCAALAGSAVGIGSALYGCRAWSLVFQSITTTLVTTILLLIVAPFRPKRTFDLAELKSVTSYSLNLTGFNIFNYVVRNADYVLIGRYLGPQSLGYYTLAYKLMLYPLQAISTIFARVMFPVFAKLQSDDDAFRRLYVKTCQCIGLVTFPMMFGLWYLARPFIMCFFGKQWEPVVLLLEILAPLGMVQSVVTMVGSIYQAKGRTDVMLRWGVATGVFYIMSFIIGLNYGVVGVASCYAIAFIITVYPALAIPFRFIGLRLPDFVKSFAGILACCVIMSVFLMTFDHLIASRLSDVPRLISLTLLGIAAYGGSVFVLLRGEVRGFLALAKPVS